MLSSRGKPSELQILSCHAKHRCRRKRPYRCNTPKDIVIRLLHESAFVEAGILKKDRDHS